MILPRKNFRGSLGKTLLGALIASLLQSTISFVFSIPSCAYMVVLHHMILHIHYPFITGAHHVRENDYMKFAFWERSYAYLPNRQQLK